MFLRERPFFFEVSSRWVRGLDDQLYWKRDHAESKCRDFEFSIWPWTIPANIPGRERPLFQIIGKFEDPNAAVTIDPLDN